MDSDTIFSDLIQGDPDICDNCFRRTRDRYERNYRVEPYFDEEEGEWDVHAIDVQAIELDDGTLIGGYDDNVFRRSEETERIPERGGYRGMVTICECGFRWVPEHIMEEWKNRPLDKSTFFEYLERLCERLREAGVDFDDALLYDIADDLKSDPDEQFADDRIYSEAIEKSASLSNH